MALALVLVVAYLDWALEEVVLADFYPGLQTDWTILVEEDWRFVELHVEFAAVVAYLKYRLQSVTLQSNPTLFWLLHTIHRRGS